MTATPLWYTNRNNVFLHLTRDIGASEANYTFNSGNSMTQAHSTTFAPTRSEKERDTIEVKNHQHRINNRKLIRSENGIVTMKQ